MQERHGKKTRLSWYGDAYAPFWGGEIQVELHVDTTRPTNDDLNGLRPILSHNHSLRDSIVSSISGFYDQLLADGARLDIDVTRQDLTPEFVSNAIDHPSIDPNPISMDRRGDVSFFDVVLVYA